MPKNSANAAGYPSPCLKAGAFRPFSVRLFFPFKNYRESIPRAPDTWWRIFMAEAKYKNGKPEINAYELPLVPCMVHPHRTDDWHFAEIMLNELEAISSANTAIEWAIQTIAELQALWIDAVDRLNKIEELARH